MSYLARSYAQFLKQAKTLGQGSVRKVSAAHDQDGWKMWKKVFIFVALPSFIIGNVNPRYFVMEDGTETDPPYVPYDRLPLWTKRFPWGDGNKSLIQTSQTNALPGGIEPKEETAIY